MKRTARLSPCGTYRWTLGRQWDDRPILLVCMFNPSDANHEIDDPTITLVCHIASHNGFGGVVVVNEIPLRSSHPDEAVYMVNTWDTRCAWDERDLLHHNISVIVSEVEKAGAVLLAWGALGARCSNWTDHVLEEIETALPANVPLYCLGRTKGGHPKHPLARGKHKVPKNAPLMPWRTL